MTQTLPPITCAVCQRCERDPRNPLRRIYGGPFAGYRRVCG